MNAENGLGPLGAANFGRTGVQKCCVCDTSAETLLLLLLLPVLVVMLAGAETVGLLACAALARTCRGIGDLSTSRLLTLKRSPGDRSISRELETWICCPDIASDTDSEEDEDQERAEERRQPGSKDKHKLITADTPILWSRGTPVGANSYKPCPETLLHGMLGWESSAGCDCCLQREHLRKGCHRTNAMRCALAKGNLEIVRLLTVNKHSDKLHKGRATLEGRLIYE